MKKLLIGIITLIPILIVTAVVATVKYIETEVPLPVDKISIMFNDEEQSFSTVAVDERGTLSAKILPTGARNKKHNYTFELGDRYDEVADEDKPLIEYMYEFNEATGEIRFMQVGELKVTVIADDGGHKSILVFNIVQENISKVEIADIIDTDLVYGGAFILPTVITPIDAKDSLLGYSSDDESVATIDKNGIVNCVGVGEVTFTAYALADASVTTSKTFTVSALPSATVFTVDVVSSSVATVDCSKYINPNATFAAVASGATLSGTNLSFAEDVAATATLTQDGQTLTVSYAPDAKGIAFKNATLIPENLFIDKAPAYLTVVSSVYGYEPSNVVWSSSDSTIASVDNGVVTPKKGGSVTITAEVSGASASVNFYCTRGILNAWLNYNKSFEEEFCGLKAEIVFGSSKLEGMNEVGNSVQMLINNTYPKQEVEGIEVNKLFAWTSSDESVATVDENGLVTIVPQTEKGTVTTVISATPKVKMYESHEITVKYTLKVNEGVDVDTFDEFKKIINEGEQNYKANEAIKKAQEEEANAEAASDSLAVLRATNLQGDIMLWRPESDWLGNACIDIYTDIIGNGHMINANEVVPEEMTGWPYPITRIRGSNIVYDNIQWRGCEFRGTEVGDLRDVGRCGEMISFDINYGVQLNDVVIKNCIVENAYCGIVLHQTNALVAGCVIRNIYAMGFSIRAFTTHSDYSNTPEYSAAELHAMTEEEQTAVMREIGDMHVRIKNVVMYDCLHACIYTYNQIGGSREAYNNLLTLEGFMKCYNWRRADQVSIEGIIGEDIKNSFEIIRTMLPLIDVGRIMDQQGEFAKIGEDGQKYYNLGVMVLHVKGLMDPTWDVEYPDDYPWSMAQIRVANIAGFDVLGMNGDSEYIGINDRFSPEDRVAMREP